MYIGYIDKEGYVLDYKTWEPTGRRLFDNEKLALTTDEKILGKGKNPHALIHKKWSSATGRPISSGIRGDFYVSNLRVVFVIEQSARDEFFFSKGALYEKPAEMIKARQFRKEGTREFFEIPVNEVVGYKSGLMFTTICILYNGKKYGLSFRRGKTRILSDFIKELKKV